MRALTVEQAQAFLRAALATPHGPVLAVALTTGMRPSEYLALKWQDLDWSRQTVSVVRSVRRLDGRWCFSDTKRSRSRRPIRLQSWIVALLRDLRTKASAQDLYSEAHDLVFRTSSGQPINADYLAKQFRSILDLAGVQGIRLYDLRHSAATIALAAGVSPKLFLSNSDTPARPSRWTLMLTCFHTCRTRPPQSRGYALSTDSVMNR